jgi:hypothetical protein
VVLADLHPLDKPECRREPSDRLTHIGIDQDRDDCRRRNRAVRSHVAIKPRRATAHRAPSDGSVVLAAKLPPRPRIPDRERAPNAGEIRSFVRALIEVAPRSTGDQDATFIEPVGPANAWAATADVAR